MVVEAPVQKLQSRIASSSLFVCGVRILINESGIPLRLSFFVKKDQVQMTVTVGSKLRSLIVIRWFPSADECAFFGID